MSGAAVDGVVHDTTPMLEVVHAGTTDVRASVDIAVAALDAFNPRVLVPLDFGVTVACLDWLGEGVHDPDRRPDEWHRYLRATTDLPDELDVGPTYRDANVLEVATIDAAAMTGAVAALLDQSCDHRPETQLAWTELYVSAGWFPLHRPLPGDRSCLVLDDLDGHRLALEVPVAPRDGRLGVGGPLRTVGLAPLELTVDNDGGRLCLRIWVRWSLWWRPDEPGRRAIDHVLDRLAHDGWEPR